jgi:hypothetical protein
VEIRGKGFQFIPCQLTPLFIESVDKHLGLQVALPHFLLTFFTKNFILGSITGIP